MRAIALSLFVLLSACASTQPSQRPQQTQETRKPTQAQRARMAFLQDQMKAQGYTDVRLMDVPSVYNIVAAVQEGRFTAEGLSGMHFFLVDSVGEDYGFGYGRHFECSWVEDLGQHKNAAGELVPLYKCTYFNMDLKISVAVIWAGTRPLEGQKLNVDYLLFVNADSYETKDAGTRARLVFLRPKWAGANDYVP